MNPKTNGPSVNESIETSLSGVFACGNVLYVHDLVDYVSEESPLAGRCAAEYVQHLETDTVRIPIVPYKGIRYMVPAAVRKDIGGDIVMRFRVTEVLLKCAVVVLFDGVEVARKNRKEEKHETRFHLYQLSFGLQPACDEGRQKINCNWKHVPQRSKICN